MSVSITLLVIGAALLGLAGLLYVGMIRNESPTFARETIAGLAIGTVGFIVLVIGLVTGVPT